MAENSSNFIYDFIDEDIASGKTKTVHTRFPPEPNGYLHIGHCKALIIDFGTAQKYNGLCNLRMDDTNPAKEDTEFVDAIKEDIHWLGFDWGDRFFYGSDYFEKTYELAEKLIENGDAYVCELTPEQFKEYRGDLTHPAISPFRDRPIEESLDLFRRMRAGEFPEGKYTLRAKIDLASGNFNMRDPVLYRIRYIEHHRQGTKWCIFPMYDFAHPIQDALEGITHSLCSLEYEDHRPLYNWVIEHTDVPSKPRQIEFARLNITNTVLSKRYLRYLVENKIVDGWDDPRMPTLCGLRRRGYTASSILDFIGRIGVSKANSMVNIELLEHCIREELNNTAARRIAVLKPIKVIIDNYPEDKVEYFDMPNNPNDPEAGTRKVPFTRELYIDSDDFALVPPPKFFRLKPDGEVRLMGSYIVKCGEIVTNEDGTVKEIHATADLVTGTNAPTDRKVKGTIHWLSAKYAADTTVVMYDRLFTEENMNDLPEGKSYVDFLNPESAVRIENVKVEPALAEAKPGEKFQFVRIGYFSKDTKNDNTFNRVVSLKDSYKPAK
ncbi:MAG: glutamine--tRNA ligase/YqeY domain fusion protein [Eubacteriales bacterium]|nr:glutamine--tRNA ligase/YqeY domain fusion protein [Clostridia bacterium]MDY2844967.1 glutamine--tRNA ligase/YqeY domain fusion protein [Eubacteriales bacterium]